MTTDVTWDGNGLSPGSYTAASAGTGDTAATTLIGASTYTVDASGNSSPQVKVVQVSGQAAASRWNITSRAASSGYARFTMPAAWPASAAALIQLWNSGNSRALRFVIGGTGSPGQIRLTNASGTTLASASSIISNSGVYWVHWSIDGATGVSQLVVWDEFGTTPLSTLNFTDTGGTNFPTTFDRLDIGNPITTPTVGAFFWDALAGSDVSTHLVHPGTAFTGSAGFSGSGTLSATAVPSPAGTASLSGSGTMTAVGGSGTVPGSAALSGSGTLAAGGSPAAAGSAGFSGSGTLSAVGKVVTAWPQAGAITPSGAMVLYATGNIASARIAYSTSSTLASPSFSGTLTPDSDGIVSATLSGLSANTVYYYGIEADGTILSLPTTRGQLRTYPTAGSQSDGSFLFGSCQVTDSNHAVFATMAAHATTYNRYGFFHLGDLHYRAWQTNGITAAATIKAQQKSSTQQANFAGLLSALPWVYLWDNNDWGGPDSDATNPAASVLEAMYRQMVPHHTTLSDADDASGAIDQTFDFGRVSFYILDTRSQRTNESATDNSSKTMLGAGQKARFKSWMSTNTKPVKVILEGIPYKSFGGASGDRWGSYLTEFGELATYFAASGIGKLYGLAGDLHVNTADDGTNESFGHVPNAVASAFDQSGTSTGAASWSQGIYPASGTNTNHQFGVLDVHDTGTTIVLTFTGYDASDVSNITMTTTVTLGFNGSAGLSGSGTLSGAGKPTAVGAAGFSGSGTLSATGKPGVARAAALSGSGTLSATAVPSTAGSAATSGSGTLSASGSASGGSSFTGTAALSGTGTLTAVASPGPVGVATLSGSGTLVAGGSPKPTGTATLSGSGTLSTTGAVPKLGGVAMLTGAGTLTTVTVVAAAGSAGFSGSGTLTGIGTNAERVTILSVVEYQRDFEIQGAAP